MIPCFFFPFIFVYQSPPDLKSTQPIKTGTFQVQYNAQMVRLHSLLIRSCRYNDRLFSNKPTPQQLSSSPYLIHPIEQRTAGLYRHPVITLDFASLYPSLYRSYNLCYSTLLLPEDVKRVPAHHVFWAPGGACFVKQEVCEGLLPKVLRALVETR